MFHKDTLRLITKTFNRFFSLLMIVMIGVAFMMGLMSCRTIMETSVDKYDDDNSLQDLQIYSSYGFDDNDVEALRKLSYVEKVFPSRFVDVFCSYAGHEEVFRVEEIDRNINGYQLIAGRMPEKEDEILLLSYQITTGGIGLGSELTFYLDGDELKDHLTRDTFTVVGIVKSPSYMAKTSSSSTLKNLDLNRIVYAMNDNFCSEYYTTVYLTFTDSQAMNGFQQEYKDYITAVKDEMGVFVKKQQDNLKDKLLSEYREKIDEGQRELDEKKTEGEKELEEARKKLEEANIQIISGQTQLATLEQVYSEAQGYQKNLEEQRNAMAQADAKIKVIEAADSRKRSFSVIYAEVTTDYVNYTSLKNAKDSTYFADSIKELEDQNAEMTARIETLNQEKQQHQQIIDSSEASEEEKLKATQRISEINNEISDLQQQIETNKNAIQTYKDLQNSDYQENIEAEMKRIDDKYPGGVEKTYNEYALLARDRATYEAISQEMTIANQTLNRISSELTQTRKQLSDARRQYDSGYKKYQKGLYTFQTEIEKAEAEIKKAYQQLEELPSARWMLLDRDSHYTSALFTNNAKQMGAIGIVMPILFFLVAALVCVTTMTRLVEEQRGQIGIFRALGFSRAQIISKYVLYALLASILGTIPGIFIGMAIFPTVVYSTWRLMYDFPDMQVVFSPQILLICILSFTLLMMVISALVVNRSLKESPSQLLRPKAPKNARKVLLEKIPFIWSRLTFTTKITVRNIFRYKSRFFMTVIGVAGCASLLVLCWGIKDAISDVVAIQFGQLMNYNYQVNLEDDSNLFEMLSTLESDLYNEFAVEKLSYSTKIYLEEGDKVINVEVMDARKSADAYHLHLTDKDTPVKLTNGGVLISEKFARSNGIKKGDMITIESEKGVKGQVRVNEICEWYFQHYIFMSADLYESVFEEPVHYTNIAVRNTTEPQFYDSIKDLDTFVSVISFDNSIEQFETMIRALDYIILVIIITAGSLAFVVLINLTQVNISERIREIATLKVLGFRDNEVNSYIFKEIFILSFIGAWVGMPLGVVEHRFVMQVINMEMIMFGNQIKFPSFAYGFAITIVFTVMVLFLTRKSLRKVEMVESLKSVE